MKVGVLGERGTCCLVLAHHGINILLDCSACPVIVPATPQHAVQQPGADAQQQQAPAPAANRPAIQLRVPQLREVVSTQVLHAVLTTSPHALLGLPHLQQLLQQEGKELPLHVYCTEPVYHAFQHLATELLETQQQLLLRQPPEQHNQRQQASQNQLHLFQLQMQRHVQQLVAQQQQQPCQHGLHPLASLHAFTPAAPPAATAVRPPVPPPLPPPLPLAAAAAPAAAGMLMGVSTTSAPLLIAARAVPGPRPPPMPPPLTAAAAAATNHRPLLQPHTAAAAAAVPPPRAPPMPPAAAAGGGALAAPTAPLPAQMPKVCADVGVPVGFGVLAVPPPRPPTAPPSAAAAAAAYAPAVPSPAAPPVPPAAAPAAVGGRSVQPPIPPPAPPPGSPSAAAAAETSDLRSGSAAAETLDEPEMCLVPMFTAQDLQSVLDQLQIVRFGERVVLPGCWGVTAEARPSGSSSVGTCMWIIRMGSQRIAYLSPASLYPNHSAPLHKPSLQALDAIILGPGSLCPDLVAPGASSVTDSEAGIMSSSYADGMLRMAASAAAHAVRAGGRVLVPVLPSGTVFQLLEHIPAALQELVPNSSQIPIFYLSPIAKDTLATVNSCCEYLEPARRDLVLSSGTAPFKFDGYVTNGRITLLTGAGSGVEGQQQQQWAEDLAKVAGAGPCVALVSLWSMAAGPGATLADMWSSNPNNLLLLTEQGPQTADWLQGCSLIRQQQQQRWQIHYYPISSTAGLPPTAVPPAAPASSIGSFPASKQAAAAGLAGQSSCKVAAACRTAAEGCLTAGQLVGLLQLHGSAVQAGSSSGSGSTVQQLILGLQDHTLLLQAFKKSRSPPNGCKITPLLTTKSPPAPLQAHTTTGYTATSISSSRATSGLNFQLIDLPEARLHVSLSKKLAESLVLTPLPQKMLEFEVKPQGSHTPSGAGVGYMPTSQLTHSGVHAVGLPYVSPSAAAAEAVGSAAAGVGGSVVGVPTTHTTYIPTDTRALQSAQGHVSDSHMHLGQTLGESLATENTAVQTSVARLKGLLRYQSGVWRLEPLAGDEYVEDAAAAAAAGGEGQQTEALAWGSVDVGTLLADLQAAGFASLYLNHEMATLDDGSEARVTVITIPEVDAELRLSEGESEVICDDQRRAQTAD